MVVYAGGHIPFFRILLNYETREDYIINPGSSSTITETCYDASRDKTTYTGATTGSQYLVTPTFESYTDIGIDPEDVIFESSNTGIATINNQGQVSYVSEGSVTITATAYDPAAGTRTNSITLSMTRSEGQATVTYGNYIADAFDASKHLLLLYNSNEADSLTCANYYKANRPGFSTANTLALNCTTTGEDGFETITEDNIDADILVPVSNWLQTNSSKPIRYIVLMYGMPSRTGTGGSFNTTYRGVQSYLHALLQNQSIRTGQYYKNSDGPYTVCEYQGTTALISSLNMNTLADAQAYIDKISSFYSGMSTPNITISADENSQGGDTYYFDDTSRVYSSSKPGAEAREKVLEENAAANITYSGDSGDTSPTPDQTVHIASASNVTGYQTWGYNGGQGGSYANSGAVSFSGQSSWYIIETIESWNGRRNTPQGNVCDWFAANAFDGAAYSNTPVMAVSHVEEPFLSGVNDGYFFSLWEKGLLGIEAAWSSYNTNKIQVIGDPLIKK